MDDVTALRDALLDYLYPVTYLGMFPLQVERAKAEMTKRLDALIAAAEQRGRDQWLHATAHGTRQWEGLLAKYDLAEDADASTLIAAVEARAIVVHEPVLFDPTGPVYDSLPHPKASRYELSGALLRDQSADPLADPDAYDRRILLVTVASAARALAALPRPEEPRVERCAVCGVGRWVIAHDPEAGPSYHPFTPEAR